MQFEVIGLVALGLGLLGWMVGPGLSIPIFFSSTLLGAAAAIILSAIGDANIQPAHLLLGFLLVAALANRDVLHAIPSALAFPRAGFWLLLTGGYAAISAVIFPPRLPSSSGTLAITPMFNSRHAGNNLSSGD